MLLNMQNKEGYTVDLNVNDIKIDNKGTVMVLSLKGLHDADVCIDVLENDKAFTGGIDVEKTTKEQVEIIRNGFAEILLKHLDGWNIPNGFDVSKKNIKAVLKSQTALWDIRKAFYDYVSEAATGKTRTQKEQDEGNLLKLAVSGLNKAG